MTTDTQAYRPEDLSARILVAAGGALLILVLALVGFAVSDSWFPGTVALLLIPVHVVLAISDTNVLEDPARAGDRAVSELRRLAGGGVLGAGFANPGATPGRTGPWTAAGQTAPTWDPPPAPGGPGAGGSGPAPQAWESDPGWESGPGWDSGWAPAPGPGPAGEPGGVPPQAPSRPNGPRPGASIPATRDDVGPPPPATGRIPLGADRGFVPPSATGPSTLYGFGSYGARDTVDDEAPAERVEPPADDPTPSNPDDDPDMTIQRPPRDH
jgi:hypothetical protein